VSRRLGLIVAALLAFGLLAGPVAGAGAATPRTTLNDVENEVMCVTCGVPLNIAESDQADRERALIQHLVDQGLTKRQIKDELVNEYGHRVLALPQDHGFGLAAYLVPIVLVLAVLAALVAIVPRWRTRRAAGAGDPDDTSTAVPTLSPEDARRLDEDLARYEI